MTFDNWNSERIGCRIKPKSKVIPIQDNNFKNYVFDIKQTFGKEYNDWKYIHTVDDKIFDYYNINNNYLDINDKEDELISNMMTSLFLY